MAALETSAAASTAADDLVSSWTTEVAEAAARGRLPGGGEGLEQADGHLAERDEVKFVICDRRDYEWARNCIRKHDIAPRVAAVLLSPASFVESGPDIAGIDGLALHDLTQWVLQDQLPVRVQIQLHKLIWDPLARGV